MLPIISEDHNLAEVAAELETRLKRFNELHAGPLRTRHIALTVRDENRNVVAGLTGEILWNAFYVHLLWVDEQYRGQGYGTSLLHRAEALAVEASCGCVYLSTFEFQAPEFYSRHGYSVIGELSGVPSGFRRQWFCRKLPPTKSSGVSEARVTHFLSQFSQWASGQNQVHGVALVGSHARGTATDASDVDLVVLADDPQMYLQDQTWVQRFGNVVGQNVEHYGDVVSLRVHYENQLHVEFGLTRAHWAALPLDPGARKVIAAGMKVLFERGSVLSRHLV